ncbi:hypothetical protein HAX54_005020 [Datura stramonium]|uniref:Uncharacterized protein n=1 Tax=Datura stramonium TaxID=4076 RepID=A0ABS8T7Y6_DATST|nr:hypothetical protein [Datura stramonium]
MTPKVSKEKGMASSSHGFKRSTRANEEQNEDKLATTTIEAFWASLGDGARRPRYDPKEIDVTKAKDTEGIHCPVLSISELHAQIDSMLSHLYDMQMLQVRMNGVIEEQLQQLNLDYLLSEHSKALSKVGTGCEEPLDDDDATDKEQVRVDSDLESDDKEEDSKMGEVVLAPTDNED